MPLLNMADFAIPRRLGFGPAVPVLVPLAEGPVGLPVWSAAHGELRLELLPGEEHKSPHANSRFFWTHGNNVVRVFHR
jgi:hypothetical protein